MQTFLEETDRQGKAVSYRAKEVTPLPKFILTVAF